MGACVVVGGIFVRGGVRREREREKKREKRRERVDGLRKEGGEIKERTSSVRLSSTPVITKVSPVRQYLPTTARKGCEGGLRFFRCGVLSVWMYEWVGARECYGVLRVLTVVPPATPSGPAWAAHPW